LALKKRQTPEEKKRVYALPQMKTKVAAKIAFGESTPKKVQERVWKLLKNNRQHAKLERKGAMKFYISKIRVGGNYLRG